VSRPANALRLILVPALLSAACIVATAAPAPSTAPGAPLAADAGYRLPAAALQAIVDAPRPPQLILGPQRDLAAMMQVPPLPSIRLVAQPELKLAGLRINARSYAPSRFSFGSDVWLMDVATGRKLPIQGLPQPLSVAGVVWSPDQRHLALNQQDPVTGANELWLVDVRAGTARRIVAGLNTVSGAPRWMPDSRQLLVNLRPDGQGEPPAGDATPAGPNVQETQGTGAARQLRTYQDMLRSEQDARLLDHYLTVQPALVSVDGAVRRIGAPGRYTGIEPSPDGRHLLAQSVERPYSYIVPLSYFPRRVEVLDLDGTPRHRVATLPLFEGLPNGNDAVPTGVRDIEWRSDAPATLVWAEAQDGGDPAKAADIRDVVYQQAAPFSSAPTVLAKLATRYAGATWGRGDVALIDEYWWKTRQQKQWLVAPDAPTSAARLVHHGSSEDRYSDPGNPVTSRKDAYYPRLQFTADGSAFFRIGVGASAEGDRPFVDRVSLADFSATRLFRSQAPTYTAPVAVLDDAGSRLLVTRESPADPPNYFVRDANGALRALTAFKHPTPQLRDIRKEQIRYARKDRVELTGTLYLPPGFRPGRDKPLPLLMWAYPAEFKSAAAASQVTDSPYRFNAVSYWGPLPFLARGFAVLDDPSMPIVGEGDREPNDSYVEQLTASAQAAVDEVVRRGVADRGRIAVGGHSYGAFMTANLLAHTRLFKAGIARSGAYNRTLTPFGFQSEERNYWDARETYQTMSPFNYVKDIKDALLMIHGEEDNNSGTFPIQSERMFAAIKGTGGTARLVMLPREAHAYRSRESIMTMLAETDDWLSRYVKNADPATTGSSNAK
jgi:dipeptidyl aminopeptidase/acylaminoacyl peptidase